MRRLLYVALGLIVLTLSYLFLPILQDRDVKKGVLPEFSGMIGDFTPAIGDRQSFAALPLKDVTGQQIQLKDIPADIYVVNLWATWCAPCLEEMPILDALAKEYDGTGVKVIPISLDRDVSITDLAQFYAEHQIKSLPIYQGQMLSVMRIAKIQGLPETILLDSEGKELGRLSGSADWNSKSAKKLINYYQK